MKKNNIITLFLLVLSFVNHAQSRVTITLSKEEAETMLLQKNLSLLAAQLNITIAEANIIQAKVWPNPTLTIDEINLWTTTYQKNNGEQLPSLFGNENFGKYRQIAAQLEQLVELAGKRKKRIAIEQVSKEIAAAYLEDFLLSLRTEFREALYNFEYSRLYIELLQKQSASLESLISAYQQQFNEGNVSKVDLIRLQATNFQLKDEIIDEQTSLNAQQQSLIVMLNLPENTMLAFTNIFDETFNYSANVTALQIDELQQKALELYPLLKATSLKVTQAEHQLVYEKSKRIPDVTFSLGYDRGGNIIQDFIGVGLSFDIPVFDRNKGGIQKATSEISQAAFIHQETVLTVKTQVREKVSNLDKIASFFTTVDTSYITNLDSSMEAYNQFFKDQTINMITYLDFMEAYIENMQILYQNQQQYYNALEELNYITGLNLQHTKH